MAGTITSTIPFADPAWHKNTSLPNFKDSHRKLQSYIRQYIDEYVIPNAHEWEANGEVSEEGFKRHAAEGFHAASVFPLPLELLEGVKLPGGVDPKEWDEFHDYILIDEMARCGYLGVVWGINGGATVGGPPLATFGTAEQKQKYLAPLLRGQQRHCLAVTEPAAGSDVAGLTTTAVPSPDGSHWILNGEKKWVTQGWWATHCLCAARTGPAGAKGLSVFIVPMDAAGITKRRLHNSGVSSSGSTYLELDNVMVPAENLLGRLNGGFEIIMSTFTHERLWVGITALRLSRVALEDSYGHALTRETFGQRLMDSAVIRSKFATMAGLIEPVQAWVEALVRASVRTPQREFSPQAALLKQRAARGLETVTREAQQVFGGLGYSRSGKGARVEQISRDVRVLVVSGGSEEILMDLVVKQTRQAARL